MKSLRAVDYPAIARAQKVAAERLTSTSRTDPYEASVACVEHKKEQSSVESILPDHRGMPATSDRGDGLAAAEELTMSSSPSSLWRWQDTGDSKASARERRRRSCLAMQRQRHREHSIPKALFLQQDLESCRGRARHARSRSTYNCYSESASCQENAANERGGSPASSQSPPGSASPPQPPPRLGEERSLSLERTLRDIGKISRRVSDEAKVLERLLRNEVEPATQKLLDAAITHHTRACRLCRVDHLEGHTYGLEKDERLLQELAPPSAEKRTSVFKKADTGTDAPPSSAVAPSLPTSSASTEAWKRAVRAGVINVGPPSVLSVRASLPGRGCQALDAGARATDDPTSSPRWSLGGPLAARCLGGSCGDNSTAVEEVVEERQTLAPVGPAFFVDATGARSDVASAATGGKADVAPRVTRVAEEATAPSPAEDFEGIVTERTDSSDAGDDGEVDEDESWGLARMVSADISSKIVGLSSLIRRKAIAASLARQQPRQMLDDE